MDFRKNAAGSGFGGAGGIAWGGGVVLLGGDAEGFEEGEVVAGEGAGGGVLAVVFAVFSVVFDLVEADGGFEHEQDVEALFADFADDTGDLVRVGDGLVDGFAEFLDKVLDLLIQRHLPGEFLECTHHAMGLPCEIRGTAAAGLTNPE
jgi:hypothetical protein